MRGRLLVSSLVLALLAVSATAARVASYHPAVGYHPTPMAAPLSVVGSIPLARLEAIDGPSTTTTVAAPPVPPSRHFPITVNRSKPLPAPTTVIPTTEPAVRYSGSYSMSDLLRRIGGCESNGAPYAPLAWTKWNGGGSGANGAFQDMGGTWQGWEREFGTDGYPFTTEAAYAPPAEQVWVNQHALDSGGTRPWVSSRGCWA